MQEHEAVDFLSRVAIFDGLTRSDLELLYGLGEMTSFAAGDTLIEEGEVRPPFQVIYEGALKVVLPKKREALAVTRATDIELNTLHPGDCFGEYSLLEDMPASASVVADQPGLILKIPHNHFKNFLASDDRIGRTVYHHMLATLVGRLKRREGEYDSIVVIC